MRQIRHLERSYGPFDEHQNEITMNNPFNITVDNNGTHSAEVFGHTVVLDDDKALLLVRDEDGWMEAEEALQDEFEDEEELDAFCRRLDDAFTRFIVENK